MFIGELDFGNVFDRDSKHFLEMLWRNGYSAKETEIHIFEIYDEEVEED